MATERIAIFDTTLRDGEQSPGCSMNLDEKVRMARQLETLGVDIIEAGFPIASEGDFAAVKAVAGDYAEYGCSIGNSTSVGPTVSCVCEIGTTPPRLVRPTVGLIPTTPLTQAGETMLPSVSVPSETAVRLADAAAADPELEPLGLRAIP